MKKLLIGGLEARAVRLQRAAASSHKERVLAKAAFPPFAPLVPFHILPSSAPSCCYDCSLQCLRVVTCKPLQHIFGFQTPAVQNTLEYDAPRTNVMQVGPVFDEIPCLHANVTSSLGGGSSANLRAHCHSLAMYS